MSPDSVESQIRDLRAKVAAVAEAQARQDERVSGLADEVHELRPLVVATTELRGGLVGVNRELGDLKVGVAKITSKLDTRDQQTSAERAANRRAILALTGVISAALIAGLATIIATALA